MEKKLVEMDSLHLTRTLNVLARGQIIGEIVSDYFCANGKNKSCIILVQFVYFLTYYNRFKVQPWWFGS